MRPLRLRPEHGDAALRYAILRLEEEHRLVRDIRRTVVEDRGIDLFYPGHRDRLISATQQQLSDIENALRTLYPLDPDRQTRPPLYDGTGKEIDFDKGKSAP